jgi:hypothetical protein
VGRNSTALRVIVDQNPQPFILTSVALVQDPTGSFWLNWSISYNAISYEIYQNNTLIAQGLTNSSFLVKNLNTGSYEFVVKASNPYGTIHSNKFIVEVMIEESKESIHGFNLTYIISIGLMFAGISALFMKRRLVLE